MPVVWTDMSTTFTATLQLAGRTATGIDVPDAVVEALGAGRRPAVRATLAGHRFRTTLGVRGGQVKLPVSAEHREAAGIAAGDEVEVTLVADAAPRPVAVPPELAAALDADAEGRRGFDALPPSRRRALADGVAAARTAETRARRVASAVAQGRERAAR